MSAIINAIDNYTNKTILSTGENGHIQYNWSTNDIESAIVQYHFQLVRTHDTTIMENKLNEIIQKIREIRNNDKYKTYLTMLYKIIAQTRDIVDGKGEYKLSYMMIYVWWHYYPDLAYFAIRQFTMGDAIRENDEKVGIPHPYGSWKDIKYLCEYVYQKTNNIEHLIIKYCVELVVGQIKMDYYNFNNWDPFSLCSKWTPRESSKYGWLFNKIAKTYFADYLKTSKYPAKLLKANIKCKQDMRKIISTLNRKLDTIQIKQCANYWDQIDHNKTTSITMVKQRNALLNQTKKGEQRSKEEHRIICAQNFRTYVEFQKKVGNTLKGKCIGLADFTKHAIQIKNNLYDKTAKDILDSQWINSSNNTHALSNMVAMCDTSASMLGDPLNVCIALGIRIAEKSSLGKRIMTFSSNPSWLDLSHIDSFVDMVDYINNDIYSKDLSTNFYKALDLFLNAIVEKRLDVKTVKNMSLIILSDMQINKGDLKWNESLYDAIARKYQEAGLKAVGEPYKVPFLVFWNLRNTDGFPCLIKQKNTAMMSGFSPSLLNDLYTKGMKAFEDYTPYKNLIESLSKLRYQCMEDELIKILV
jgi:hypothetical protein